MSTEILLVVGQYAVASSIELCKRLVSLDIKTVLIISSTLASQLPPSFRENTLIHVFQIPVQEVGCSSGPVDTVEQHLKSYLTTPRSIDRGPVGAIVDMGSLNSMGWLVEMFSRNHIPTCGFVTSSAFSAVKEFVASSPQQDINWGWLSKCLPACGLAESGEKVIGLTVAGDHPMPMSFMRLFMGMMINTCDDLERPFIEEFRKMIKLRVWSVGPLLPRENFRLYGTAVRSSNEGEATVINWLDSKPRGSVLFVSFGSSVNLTTAEYSRLADALGSSTHSFIWVVPPESHSGGYYPTLNGTVDDRGMITGEVIPHCKILNHPAVAGFLSHCNWEAVMESIGLGVPLLAWPRTGEEMYNAELIVKKLKVGYYIGNNFSHMVNGKDFVKSIGKGIDKLIRDKHMKKKVADLSAKFSLRLYESSRNSLARFEEVLGLL